MDDFQKRDGYKNHESIYIMLLTFLDCGLTAFVVSIGGITDFSTSKSFGTIIIKRA